MTHKTLEEVLNPQPVAQKARRVSRPLVAARLPWGGGAGRAGSTAGVASIRKSHHILLIVLLIYLQILNMQEL